MSHNLKKYFLAKGLPFVAIDHMKCGDIEQLGQRALQQILSLPAPLTRHGIHLLGHSMGGLVARWLVRHLQGVEIKSLITVATPHRGSQLAENLANVDLSHPLLYRAAQLIGYSIEERKKYFLPLHRQRVENFNKDYTLPANIQCMSASFALPPTQMSWPMRAIQNRFPTAEQNDGIVELSSQGWGESLGVFSLDHFAQLGFFFYLNPQKRQAARAEFFRLLETLESIYQ
jgi:triacylglycerol lipase